MDLARDGYWFEGRKEWALDLLSCLEGITTEQSMKILRGEAILKGISSTDTTVGYYDMPDKEFQKRLSDYDKWIAEQVEKKRKEAEEEMNFHEAQWDEISKMGQRADLMRKASLLRDELMEGRPEKPKEIVPPKNPVKLGKFVVEKELLDNYLKVASDHDLMDPWSAGTALLLSGRMMRIHLMLRESVGLHGFWGRSDKRPGEPDAFDKALQAAVHSNNRKDDRYIELQKRRRQGSGSEFAAMELAEASLPQVEKSPTTPDEVYKRLHPKGEDGKLIKPLVTGIPASRGRASGPVKLVLDEKDFASVKKGDVLVTTMIVPDTIFAIDKIAALVTDVGGLTSHAAIVSREFHVPCIVGAIKATKSLKDGQRVTVDGTTGKVFPEGDV